MAEGQFTWQDSSGREVYVRNLALIVGGSYHVIQVIGPEDQRDKVTEIYEEATTAYRVTALRPAACTGGTDARATSITVRSREAIRGSAAVPSPP